MGQKIKSLGSEGQDKSKALCLYVLKKFYMEPFDASVDFYEQFYKRLEVVRLNLDATNIPNVATPAQQAATRPINRSRLDAAQQQRPVYFDLGRTGSRKSGYSENNLKMAQEMGYKTFFWSLAYVYSKVAADMLYF